MTSAGNRNDDVMFYSPKWRYDNVVVGATDDRDRPAIFTNYGLLVSVVAPGSGDFFQPGILFPQRAILSTRSSGAGLDADGGGAFTVGGEYLRWVGTSMSTPHVAGIAALVLALHPDWSPAEVRAVIRGTARDLGEPGFDIATGAGLADAARAVQSPRPTVLAQFTAPMPGAAVVPDADRVAIRAALTGVASATLAVGTGRIDHFDPVPLPRRCPTARVSWRAGTWPIARRLLRAPPRGPGRGRQPRARVPAASLERNTPRRLCRRVRPRTRRRSRASAWSGNRRARKATPIWVSSCSRRTGDRARSSAWSARRAINTQRACRATGSRGSTRATSQAR